MKIRLYIDIVPVVTRYGGAIPLPFFFFYTATQQWDPAFKWRESVFVWSGKEKGTHQCWSACKAESRQKSVQMCVASQNDRFTVPLTYVVRVGTSS